MPLFSWWFTKKGAEFGRSVAEPHAKKPGFVFSVALIFLAGGSWLAWQFRDGSSKPFFWTGVVLAGFAFIGFFRGTLLLFGKDFE